MTSDAALRRTAALMEGMGAGILLAHWKPDLWTVEAGWLGIIGGFLIAFTLRLRGPIRHD